MFWRGARDFKARVWSGDCLNRIRAFCVLRGGWKMKSCVSSIILALLFFCPVLSRADVSCGSYSGKLIGVEVVATNCNASVHIMTGIECSGGSVALWSHQGDWSYGANLFADYYANQGYRVFRNSEGTRLVAVDSRYVESIDGLNMSDYAAGAIHYDVFDKVLYPATVPLDSDNDHYLACDECNDADPAVNPGVEESCSDGVDNNCDGLTDCTDPFCADDEACEVRVDVDPLNFPRDCQLEK